MRTTVVVLPYIASPWKCNTRGTFGVLESLFFYNPMVVIFNKNCLRCCIQKSFNMVGIIFPEIKISTCFGCILY